MIDKCCVHFNGNRIKALLGFMLRHKGKGYELEYLSKKFSLRETTLFHTSGMSRSPFVKAKRVKFARASINGKCIIYLVSIEKRRFI